MDVNRNNGEKCGNDGYDGRFGSNHNAYPNLYGNTVGHLPTTYHIDQQPDHFQNDFSNGLPQDINVAYEGNENQSSYGFGPNNYVPQFCNPTGYYYVGQPQQQLPSSHLEYDNNGFGNALTGVSNVGYSNHLPQQIQAVQESPMNFEVPSINTYLSNESNNFVDDFVMLDISNNKTTLQGNDKLLSQMTDDEICAASGDFNPFCVPVTPLSNEEEAPKEVYGFNQDPEMIYGANHQQNAVANDTALKTVFVECLQNSQPAVNIPSIPLNKSKKASKNAKAGSSRSKTFATTKKPGPGRPPTYKNEEDRKEARRKSSNKYERRIKQEKDSKRQMLKNTLVVLTNINQTLRQRLNNVKTELANYKQANFDLLTQDQKKIYFQKTQMLKM